MLRLAPSIPAAGACTALRTECVARANWSSDNQLWTVWDATRSLPWHSAVPHRWHDILPCQIPSDHCRCLLPQWMHEGSAEHRALQQQLKNAYKALTEPEPSTLPERVQEPPEPAQEQLSPADTPPPTPTSSSTATRDSMNGPAARDLPVGSSDSLSVCPPVLFGPVSTVPCFHLPSASDRNAGMMLQPSPHAAAWQSLADSDAMQPQPHRCSGIGGSLGSDRSVGSTGNPSSSRPPNPLPPGAEQYYRDIAAQSLAMLQGRDPAAAKQVTATIASMNDTQASLWHCWF